MEQENSIDLKRIQKRYNSLDSHSMWDDHWHSIVRLRIEKHLTSFVKEISKKLSIRSILNAGSGGNTYNIQGSLHLHLDVSLKLLLAANATAVLGSMELLPLTSNLFDLCICVGSAINYTNAVESLQEMGRVLKPNGFLILEFERSESAEQLGSAAYGRKVAPFETEYRGERELIWLYSEKFIRQALKGVGLSVVRRRRFHIVSPLAYRLTLSEKFSVPLSVLDGLFEALPGVSSWAANTIFLCRKFS
jgi:SAM-dependent methyltransferase